MNTWIESQIKKLPESMMKYLASPLFTRQLDEIVSLFEMSGEEKQDVKDEVYLFALGGTHPLDFPARIQLYSGLEDEKAELLAEKIMTELIDPIAGEMVEFWMSEIPEEADNVQQTTSSLPNNGRTDNTTKSQPLSNPTHKPNLKKTITDQDIADARRALTDRYREPLK
jgi:hypothetical protein